MKLLNKGGLWLYTTLLMLCSCSHAQMPSPANNTSLTGKNILIVYLSRTKNTKAIAEIIHQKVGGDLLELDYKIHIPKTTSR